MEKKKISQLKIKIPDTVKIKKQNDFLIILGPLGCNKINIRKLDRKGLAAFSILSEKNTIILFSHCNSFFGSIFRLIQSKIDGVVRGFITYLRIVGIGYRCRFDKLYNQTVHFKLGFSHEVNFQVPHSVRVFLIEPTLLCIYGIDKNQVTQAAAKIKQIRAPSVYKGKGIRLINEVVYLKQGKVK